MMDKKEKALFVFKKMKSELIHNMLVAEGNTLTALQTKTLIDSKITPAGANADDVEQAMRLSRAFDEIAHQVKKDAFQISKENFIKINSIVAINEALSVGDFRNEQVFISGTDYVPPKPSALDDKFNQMIKEFNEKENIEEKASDLFLDSARNQYFFDGNKRTAQLIMNGYLMSHGIPPRSIVKEKIEEYDQKMHSFYSTNDKTEMYEFLQEISNHKRYTLSSD